MPRRVERTAPWIAAALAGALATVVGCPIPDAQFRDATGAGGGGGAGGAAGAGGSALQECVTAADCPMTGNECVVPTCIGGLCGTDNVDQGSATATQAAGDCKLFVCDGTGGTTTKELASDTLDDNKECTIDGCSGGAPTSTYKPAGVACSEASGVKCDGAGSCVECLLNADCVSGLCGAQKKCVPASCGDSVKNGSESDVDCGGPDCGATCQTDAMCGADLDCQSGVCKVVDKVCAAPACDDGVKNGNETDKDCGGGGPCKACGSMLACTLGTDCLSGVCSGGLCKDPTCNDGVLNASETDVDCGGPDCPLCPTVLLLAGGAAGSLLGEYHPNLPWATKTSTEKASFAPGIAITSAGKGVGTMEFSNTPATNGGPLRYTIWNAGSGFDAFKDVAAGVTARGALVASSSFTAHVVFFGDNGKHYYAAHKGGQWSPTAEAVGSVASQSFGPSVPAITALGNDVYIAYAGSDGNLYDQGRIGGVWGGAALHDIATNPGKTVATPAITALTAGPEMMIVFNVQSGSQMYWTARTNGVWTKPDTIPNALTNDPASLLALPQGNAIVAFRGTDNKLYASRFVGGSWSQAAAPLSPNPTLASPPALSRGVGGAVAELAYMSSAGVAYHSRLVGANWTQAISIGGSGLSYVSIASGP